MAPPRTARRAGAAPPRWRTSSLLALAGGLVLYGLAMLRGGLPPSIGLPYLATLSALCFAAYALDKRAARRPGARRTPERTLLWLGFLGGWPGAVLAQEGLRHKSVKPGFRAWFQATVLLHLLLFALAFTPLGTHLAAWLQKLPLPAA